MELLSQLTISRPEGDASIQLLYGDLTTIPHELAVDILAVSAFRGDYLPVPDTLIGALYRAGLSVAELATHKDMDLLNQLSCWLSESLSPAQQARFNIKKILCFEPIGNVSDAETEVGNLFRGINTFAMDADHNDIAMPILATGNQQIPLEIMLPLLLDSALFWLENGLPLNSLKFALHRPDQVAKGRPIFENARKQYELKKQTETGQISASQSLSEINLLNRATSAEYTLPKLTYALQEKAQAELDDSLESFEGDTATRGDIFSRPAPVNEYDYFISYSHLYSTPVQEFVNALQAHNPQFRIFYDRDSIPTGGLWIKLISDAIQNSKNVICILTPEYSQSPVCWDEFQCAKAKEYRTRQPVIKTINFCNDANMPLMLSIYSYIDCTEADLDKLKNAVAQLVDN